MKGKKITFIIIILALLCYGFALIFGSSHDCKAVNGSESEVNLIPLCPPIRDQGHRGTCVVHGSVAFLEFELINHKGYSNDLDLSEQYFFWACKQRDGFPNDDGTFTWVARDVMMEDGACLESTWPYISNSTGDPAQGPPLEGAVEEAKQYTFGHVEYYMLPSDINIDILKKALADRHIIVFGVPVYASWFSNETKKTGEIPMPLSDDCLLGGHCMDLVGYKDNESYPRGGYFFVRNSWKGENWANESEYGLGYGTIPYAYIERYWDEGWIVSPISSMVSIDSISLPLIASTSEEPGTTEHRKEAEKNGSNYSRGCSVQKTIEGGYVIAGYTNASTSGNDTDNDAYLIKVDSKGNMKWNQTYGGSSDDKGYSVQQTSDGGYILVGDTFSKETGYLAYLIKTNSQGNEEWNRTFGFGKNSCVSGSSALQTEDGGYLILAQLTSFEEGLDRGNIWLIKTDSQGNEEWNRTYGVRYGWPMADLGGSFQQTSDSGYIIVGHRYTRTSDYPDLHLIKTDQQGNEEWNRTYGGPLADFGRSAQQTPDGGYIIAGSTYSYGKGGYDMYLIKVDQQGEEEWNRTFGGPLGDYAHSVQQTLDGGYIIAGQTGSIGAGNYDMYLIKTDSHGYEEWEKTYGGVEIDYAYSLQQTSDGGYILVGSTSSFNLSNHCVYLIKTGEDGNEEWSYAYPLNDRQVKIN